MTIYEAIEQSYAMANAMLAVTHMYSGALDIPAAHRLDVNRYEMSVKIGAEGFYRTNDSQIRVNGASGSNAYQDLRLMTNEGAGTVAPDYARAEASAGSTGHVIARKTAVRGVSTSGTVWAEQINLGPYTQAGLYISSDGQQTAVPYVVVVQYSLDVGKAVTQWNRSAASTGDYLRVLNSDSSFAFRITGDGDVVWGKDDSLRADLKQMRTEIAELRSQVQALKTQMKRE